MQNLWPCSELFRICGHSSQGWDDPRKLSDPKQLAMEHTSGQYIAPQLSFGVRRRPSRCVDGFSYTVKEPRGFPCSARLFVRTS